MSKPHSKLLAFNKIYYEMKKKYGFTEANKWLKEEWIGSYYMHDAPSTSTKPYCIAPDEMCTFIYNDKKINTTLNDIYSILEEDETFDSENKVWFKKPNNLLVLDCDRSTLESRYTKVEMISKKETDKDLYFTKGYNGSNIITTEDHKFITKNNGDIPADHLIEDETKIISYFDDSVFTNSVSEYNGLILTYDLGWLLGMYLAEGYESLGSLFIAQSSKKSPDEYSKIIRVLSSLNIKYTETKHSTEYNSLIRIADKKWGKIFKSLWVGRYCDEKHLCTEYTSFPDDFLKGVLAGIIDGDGTIRSNNYLMIRLTSRPLINQLRSIGLHFGIFLGSRTPYIQNYRENKINQKKPMYAANVNMARYSDFFDDLKKYSIKVEKLFTAYNYDPSAINKNYTCEFGEVFVRDSLKTYKNKNIVFDLSTESHTFICNDILVHNCYAYTLERLAKEGLFFITNFNYKAPEHLTTFIDFVAEFVSWNCNRTSGKLMCPSVSFPLIKGVN